MSTGPEPSTPDEAAPGTGDVKSERRRKRRSPDRAEPLTWPQRLHEYGRRLVFLVFVAVFLLTVHELLWAPAPRVMWKLQAIQILAGVVAVGFVTSGLGWCWNWWQERPKRALEREEARRQRKRRQPRGTALPWQQGHRE